LVSGGGEAGAGTGAGRASGRQASEHGLVDGRLTGKVCLVTGSTGIAAAGAERFSAEGARVFVVSRTEEHCRALVDRVREHGGDAAFRVADLTDEAATAAAVRACLDAFGRIDGLFAVAGGSGRRFGDGPADEMTVEGWDRTFELNAKPVFLATRAALRAMLAASPTEAGTRGSILLMSSILAFHPSPGHFATHAYAASKGAIATFGRVTAAYYAPHGIRVNVVAPSLVTTPMSSRASDDPGTQAFVAWKQPLSRAFMPAEDVAAAAAFFLSDESRYVTGQLLEVDGGWSVTGEAPGT
jgi:NAD(P)-dependent dehydrogenase (short-subunit alcohol dehydrogenase family)